MSFSGHRCMPEQCLKSILSTSLYVGGYLCGKEEEGVYLCGKVEGGFVCVSECVWSCG
jgi:hypothetical protein